MSSIPFSHYLSHSTVLHPPYERGCFQMVSHTLHTQSRKYARSAAEHASLPVQDTEGIVTSYTCTRFRTMWVIKVCLFLRVGARTHSHDLSVAAGTGRGKELSVTVLTVNIILLLHKADISQRCVAVMAVKLLWVPRAAQRHQERPSTPEWIK